MTEEVERAICSYCGLAFDEYSGNVKTRVCMCCSDIHAEDIAIQDAIREEEVFGD